MSNEATKEIRSKRLHAEEVKIQKQVKIAKAHGLTNKDKAIKEPHRLAKHHAMDCGQPGCVMCGNPRKTFKELTIQEKSFEQTENWTEVDSLEND
jgi:hypothetical protein